MLLVKDGITMDVSNPADVAHLKELGYVEVVEVTHSKKKIEVAAPVPSESKKEGA